MGAGGRDFQNFNTCFRDNPRYDVKCFTATQIPNIEGRRYPPAIAGKLYKKGIPIFPEKQFMQLIKKFKIDLVVFSYSDVKHEYVMHRASQSNAAGARFALLGTEETQLKSKKPVIAVCAVRTGAGKSPTSRYVVDFLQKKGLRVAAVRHPMPYGDLKKQAVQKFEVYKDFDKHKCTIEEREEYEPYIKKGVPIFAGVDYERILREAEKGADVILWDGGNNDTSFFKTDLLITVADPHRAGHELLYYPGETNFRSADIILISKSNTATKKGIETIKQNARQVNPKAPVIKTSMKLLGGNSSLKNRKVLVVEDGPTLTHGEMKFGAGMIVAKKYGAKVVDAEKYAVGSIRAVYKKYTHLKKILPAMGYGKKQIKELEKTINRARCDFVIEATPVNLTKLIRIRKPVVSIDYVLASSKQLNKVLGKFARSAKKRR